eukprot:maker-scaffold_1-snap-gene-32.49-mRNA-1 protein AED:0.01 eAED:0.01 QI:171/1/1/1/0.5/0.33/3/596/548
MTDQSRNNDVKEMQSSTGIAVPALTPNRSDSAGKETVKTIPSQEKVSIKVSPENPAHIEASNTKAMDQSESKKEDAKSVTETLQDNPADRKSSKPPADFKGNFSRERTHSAGSGRLGSHRDRETGGKLFVGNLETESISYDDFEAIWKQYGRVDEVAMHKGYGFVSFCDSKDMDQALQQEQGRLIGTRKIDVQIAKNQRDKMRSRHGGRYERYDSRRGYESSRGRGFRGSLRGRAFGKRKERDRYQSDGYDNRYPKRPSQSDMPPAPIDGHVVKIILLGEQQRRMANEIASRIGHLGVPLGIEMLDGRTLSGCLRDSARNGSRYVLIIGKDNMRKRTVTLKFLHYTDRGHSPTFDLDFRGIVEEIEREERRLGFLVGSTENPVDRQGYSATDFLAHQRPDTQPRSSPLYGNNYQQPIPQAAPNSSNLTSMQGQLAAMQKQLQSLTSQQSSPQVAMPINNPNQHNMQEILQQQQQLQQQLQQLMNSSKQANPSPSYQTPSSSVYPNNQSFNRNYDPPAREPPRSGKNMSTSDLNDLSRLLQSIKHRKQN